MLVWRISGFADLSGRGGVLHAARWNHRGTAIVYTSDHVSTALLELLVHADLDLLPERYQLLAIDIPETATVETADLPEGWQDDIQATRDLWQDFVARAAAPVLAVPSAITPHTRNYLINPALAEVSGIRVSAIEAHRHDPRFRL
ncbi:MAG: RES family NAD+ phosphorylase [Nitratireductor sp.]|nr:RES family NAD+ phosphorylase [Nitratireductor sp.]